MSESKGRERFDKYGAGVTLQKSGKIFKLLCPDLLKSQQTMSLNMEWAFRGNQKCRQIIMHLPEMGLFINQKQACMKVFPKCSTWPAGGSFPYLSFMSSGTPFSGNIEAIALKIMSFGNCFLELFLLPELEMTKSS